MYKRIASVLLAAVAFPAHAQSAGSRVFQLGVLNGRTLDSSTPLRTDVKPGLGALIGIPESFDSPGTAVKARDVTTLQVALSYFMTDHIALEGAGGIPPQSSLRGKGVVQPNANINALSVNLGADGNNPIATSRQWSPVVLVQYYFRAPAARWRPELGIGVTYTFFTDVTLDRDFKDQLNTTFGHTLALANLKFPVGGTKVKAKSAPDWAPIAEAGISYAFDEHWGTTVSVSYVGLKTTSTINIDAADGTRLSHSTTKIDLDTVATALLISYKF